MIPERKALAFATSETTTIEIVFISLAIGYFIGFACGSYTKRLITNIVRNDVKETVVNNSSAKAIELADAFLDFFSSMSQAKLEEHVKEFPVETNKLLNSLNRIEKSLEQRSVNNFVSCVAEKTGIEIPKDGVPEINEAISNFVKSLAWASKSGGNIKEFSAAIGNLFSSLDTIENKNPNEETTEEQEEDKISNAFSGLIGASSGIDKNDPEYTEKIALVSLNLISSLTGEDISQQNQDILQRSKEIASQVTDFFEIPNKIEEHVKGSDISRPRFSRRNAIDENEQQSFGLSQEVEDEITEELINLQESKE